MVTYVSSKNEARAASAFSVLEHVLMGLRPLDHECRLLVVTLCGPVESGQGSAFTFLRRVEGTLYKGLPAIRADHQLVVVDGTCGLVGELCVVLFSPSASLDDYDMEKLVSVVRVVFFEG